MKVYHVLQPSPAGKLCPTLYTLPPLRHTGGTVGLTATLQTWPQPLEQHFWPCGQLSSPEQSSTQIPTEPGGSGGHTSGEGTVEGLIKKSKKIKQSVIEGIELKYNTTGIVCLL